MPILCYFFNERRIRFIQFARRLDTTGIPDG